MPALLSRRIPAILAALILLAGSLLAQSAQAQTAQVPFGGLRHDPTLPIEISADQLKVDQATGQAIFIGHVKIGQGDMRLEAGKVRVEYVSENGDATGRIAQMFASGGVTLVNGAEAAEAREAQYTVTTGIIVMTGDVILTQGANALASERLVVDLNKGTATLLGRVRTIFTPGSGGGN